MGWLSDVIDLGRDAIQDQARQRLGQVGQSAHIDAQNQVVEDFELRALTPHRSGLLTAAQAIAEIQRLDGGFTTYCQALGYGRALRGASDVHNLALTLIRDLQNETVGGGVIGPGGIVLPPVGGVYSGTTIPWSTILLGAGILYAVTRRGRIL